MDLSQPGADLIGAADATVLRTLARLNQAISGREVARLADINASSTRRSLARLSRIGLVDVVAMKHALLYSVNREHVLWEPVRAMLTATERLRQRIAVHVTDRLGDRASVAVFGSVARGDSSIDSDVDLALVFDDDVPAAQREALTDELTLLIERATGNSAQILSIDHTQLQAMVAADDPLVSAWRRDGQTISGPALAGLLNVA